MDRQGRHQDERGPLHVLLLPPGPCDCFPGSMGRAVKEVAAGLVADVPRVEARHPGLHLLRCDLLGVVNEGRQDPGLVPAALPEPEGEVVILSQIFCDRAEGWHGDAPGSLRVDAEPGHAPDVLRISKGFQPGHEGGVAAECVHLDVLSAARRDRTCRFMIVPCLVLRL